jgi:hypothetical protein
MDQRGDRDHEAAVVNVAADNGSELNLGVAADAISVVASSSSMLSFDDSLIGMV